MSTYDEVTGQLRRAGVEFRELSGPGRAAVARDAGRVAVLAFDDGTSLLWSSPALGAPAALEDGGLPGGFGGDRLWFGPEMPYFWSGEPDWVDFTNNSTLPEMDPGAYEFVAVSDASATLRSDVRLSPLDDGPEIRFAVERTLTLIAPPEVGAGVEAVGVEATHRVTLAGPVPAGRLDLWHLLQIPPGSTLIVPLHPEASDADREPQSYSGPSNWVRLPDQLRWRYTGEQMAKLGVSVHALTGRSAVVRPLGGGRWLLLVRDFAADPAARYVDYPYGIPRDDQALQAWDGFGFGEMEFHGPQIVGDAGDEYTESDRLWAFRGDAAAIAAAATTLLGVDISDALVE